MDANVSSAYTAPTIQSPINHQDADFANALNCRGETSKFAALIGSCDLSMNHLPFLFDIINESSKLSHVVVIGSFILSNRNGE